MCAALLPCCWGLHESGIHGCHFLEMQEEAAMNPLLHLDVDGFRCEDRGTGIVVDLILRVYDTGA